MASSRSAASLRRSSGRHRRPSRASVVVPTGVTGGLLLATAATGVAAASPAAASASAEASNSSSSAQASQASQSSPDLPAYPGELLTQGDTGNHVEKVQGVLGVATDGIFGPVTEAAVIQFQREKGLAVDGIVGPNTWSALKGGGSSGGGGSEGDAKVTFASSKSSASDAAAKALEVAMAQTDDPYVYGAEGPEQFDCSGLVNYAYSKAGVDNLPRTTGGLIGAGERVSRSELQPGDLVFTSPGHVGLYVGDGKMVSARNPESGIGVHGIWEFHAGVRV